MITEVQIRKSRSYLPHLRRVVSGIAVRLGMSRRAVEETEDAVSEACSGSIDAADAQGGSLSIKLSVHEACMTVDITDSASEYSEGWLGEGEGARISECISDLADAVRLIEDDSGATVRIVKHVRGLKPASMDTMPYLAAAGTAGSQG